jgi:hypothetical protein
MNAIGFSDLRVMTPIIFSRQLTILTDRIRYAFALGYSANSAIRRIWLYNPPVVDSSVGCAYRGIDHDSYRTALNWARLKLAFTPLCLITAFMSLEQPWNA